MGTTRRTFLQLSATATAALALPGDVIAGSDNGSSAMSGKAAAAEDSRIKARAIPLDKVRLTGGPLKKAQDADIQYLLELEPDRMLAFYRARAGLQPKAEGYGGWDGGGHG